MTWLAVACVVAAVVLAGSPALFAVMYEDRYCDYQPTFNPEAHDCFCEEDEDSNVFTCQFIIDDMEYSVFTGCQEQSGNTCTPKYDNDCGKKFLCLNGCINTCTLQTISCETLYSSCTGT
jgi:hypothetical protein